MVTDPIVNRIVEKLYGDEVTHEEEGCTCGGMATCQQCQERDAVSESVEKVLERVLYQHFGDEYPVTAAVADLLSALREAGLLIDPDQCKACGFTATACQEFKRGCCQNCTHGEAV